MRSIVPARFVAVALATCAAPAAADLFAYRHQVLYPAVVLDGDFAYRRFGAAVATGDFNGDGNDEVAVGTPGTDHTPAGGPEVEEAGTVQIYRARGSDFDQILRRQLTQEDFGVLPEPFDHFGEVLATGDFDDDGFDDLALGTPGENLDLPPVRLDAGMVQVIYGGEFGLDGDRTATAILDQLGATAADNENLGAALAVGDFDGDGYDDLAIGAPGRDVGALDHAGWVIVVYGGPTGLVWSDHEHLHQDVEGVLGTAAADERFGAALAAGNFGGAGPDDLAVGAPDDTADNLSGSGAVHVFYGASGGLLPANGDQFWHQDGTGVEDDGEANDFFGAALAAGDFDDDGLVDLAVGVPGEDLEGPPFVGEAGRLHLFYADPAGFLSVAGDEAAPQPCVCGCPANSNQYGQALAAGDVDGAGGDDLLVGQPLQNLATIDVGTVCLGFGGIYGYQWVRQDLPGLGAGNDLGDQFGRAIAVGRMGARRYVAIGVPFEEVPSGPADQGRVVALFDAVFADGFGTGDTIVWSSTVP